MTKLKKVQERYLKGEITNAQYETELKALLDDGTLDQDQYDDALDYDPEHEKPQFSQAEVDNMIASKAVKLVRKALKDAGVSVEADNKTLLAVVAEQLKAAQTASLKTKDKDPDGNSSHDEEIGQLRTQADRVTRLIEKVRGLTIENAVLRAAGKFNPVNPVQVVRALQSDYMDYIEIDDESGEIDKKSVDRALKKCFDAEPNLFKDQNNPKGTDFKGKGPGGGSGAPDSKHAAKKAEALEMLGLGSNKK